MEIQEISKRGTSVQSRVSCVRRRCLELDAFPVTELKDSSGAGDWCSAGVIDALCQNGQSGLSEATHGRVIQCYLFGSSSCRVELPFRRGRAAECIRTSSREFQTRSDTF